MAAPIGLSRRLRCYSFDPSLAADMATWDINEILVNIPQETDDNGVSTLRPGPVGEYIEVVDADPSSRLFYKPVDLNDPSILIQNGLPASENNPQFHQQMVYAVAMATIDHFEQAFGRKVFWSNHVTRDGEYQAKFVRRLRIYPHALRARNAYYSPRKKALLFGYFPVTSKDEKNTPGTTVFSCLSHDIIVHEMSHALLDGVHPRFNEPTNPDVHAFHEGFADIVAIFQRFSYEGVLESQIAETRGDLSSENILAQLAQQFGRATGRGSALRDALGGIDSKTGKWQIRKPDPRALEKVYEPHTRGAILVAAVFRAFTLIYQRRVADLFRLATGGTGVLPEGSIHPDLVGRLASEAREVAAHVLRMCIRGLDYCPPVDLTFGDYLRAIVTADVDIHPEDAQGNRVAFVQSFREWGIAPLGIRSMSVDTLIWDDYATAGARQRLKALSKDNLTPDTKKKFDSRALQTERQRYQGMIQIMADGLSQGSEAPIDIEGETSSGAKPIRANPESAETKYKIQTIRPWDHRLKIWLSMQESTYPIWRWLNNKENAEMARALNLVLDDAEAPRTVYRNKRGDPTVEVHAVRPIQRRKHRLSEETLYVVEVTQRRRGYFDVQEQLFQDGQVGVMVPSEKADFTFRAGATFFLNPETFFVDWVMPTAGNVADTVELGRMRQYLTGQDYPRSDAFDPGLQSISNPNHISRDEPFAFLHDHDGGN